MNETNIDYIMGTVTDAHDLNSRYPSTTKFLLSLCPYLSGSDGHYVVDGMEFSVEDNVNVIFNPDDHYENVRINNRYSADEFMLLESVKKLPNANVGDLVHYISTVDHGKRPYANVHVDAYSESLYWQIRVLIKYIEKHGIWQKSASVITTDTGMYALDDDLLHCVQSNAYLVFYRNQGTELFCLDGLHTVDRFVFSDIPNRKNNPVSQSLYNSQLNSVIGNNAALLRPKYERAEYLWNVFNSYSDNELRKFWRV